ncbi:choline transporter-like protein 4 [Aplysia californica]|uniref:Choline transporter-like protein n=1 Tax=Aplysia californica TaxID=6500 RepID=A0ABM1AC91_APLCA|nr:choline transporter-like protein 4 [Aplysia californica]
MGKKTKVEAFEASDRKDSPLKSGYDPGYKGPKQKRSCTDIICCLLFLIFIAGLVVVAYFAFLYGNPKLLIYPQDSNGNLCGQGDFKDRPYLFFFDLVKCGRMGPGVFVNGCPTPQVCVSKCPDSNYIAAQDYDSTNLDDLICIDSINKDTNTKKVQDLVLDEECAAYYLDSTVVINRCLPIQNLLDFGQSFMEIKTKDNTTYNITESDDTLVTGDDMELSIQAYELFLEAKEYGEKIVADVVASWWMILIGLGISMLISLLWITLMRWIAGFMVWLTILAFVVIWAGLTGICWYFYLEEKDQNREFTVYLVWRLTFQKEDVFLAGGLIFGVIFIIVFLLLLFLCQRIRIAIALIQQASKAVGSMWSTLFWPLLPFILQIAVIAFWGVIATFLASVGREPKPSENNVTFANGSINEEAVKIQAKGLFEYVGDCNETESDACEAFIKFEKGDYTIYLQLYNLFMLFWLVNFVAALGDLTLSGAFSSYYWAFNKPKDIPTFPLMGAFWRSFRYHLGSLAFGSLLIAIVQVIRTMLEYLDSKLKASENPVAKFFMKCLKCCFWCLEKFLRFLCKNAFIMMAVYGKNFCVSAKRAFDLILKNVVRVFVLDKVTDFLLFICKLVVVGATGVISYFFFDGRITFVDEYRPELNFYIVPIIITILGSYIIAQIFFSVYEMAVDTLFLCFLDDIERNDGSPEKPYFMGKELMKLLGKKNLRPKTDDEK